MTILDKHKEVIIDHLLEDYNTYIIYRPSGKEIIVKVHPDKWCCNAWLSKLEQKVCDNLKYFKI